MSGWARHSGVAVILRQANIDTDQLIPARFMSRPRSEGYGELLMHDQRDQDAEHPLNVHRPTILVAGRNFGSGSSREAAVYALVDYGIRVVLAPSFGDIFAGNATNNGLLAGRISEGDLASLTEEIAEAVVDLRTRRALIGGHEVLFEIDDVSAEKLMNGWDDIDLTQQYSSEIAAFRTRDQMARPWADPVRR